MDINYESLVPIIGGAYALLAVHGKIAAGKNSETLEEWKKMEACD